MTSPPLDYVLPLKWSDDRELDELTAYLRRLALLADVIVVDGSPPELFGAHAAAWQGLCRHVRPAPYGLANGKVSGVLTGMALARHEHVVIADDDVRYDARSLRRVVELLGVADLVGPQNYFDRLPWHALWDTARTLLNRSLGADYPGTFAVRRSTFQAMGGYDGDVLFENLELMRTVRAHGGRVIRPLDVYVVRRPPEAGRFWNQRVRQAYDDLAQPVRLAAELSIVPGLVLALARRRTSWAGSAAFAAVAMAEAGRRRSGGTAFFPARATLFAPAWLLERGVCVWVAVGARVFKGGVPYAGRRLRVAAHSERALRRRLHERSRTNDVAVGEPVGWRHRAVSG